jgi:hypothetical protein
MQSKTQSPHEVIPPAPVHADQGTEFLQSSTLNGGTCIREFFAVPDVYPESLLRADETVTKISYADATLSEEIQPDPWWYAIPAALSWVKNFLIEGFAAYGAAMQPGYFLPYEMDHADWRVLHYPLPKTHRDREVVVSSVDSSDVAPVRASQAAASRWPAWLRSPLVRLQADRPLTGRTGSMMTRRDDPDDGILQDIGYLDYESAYLVIRGKQRE